MVLEVDARQYPITTHFSRVTAIESYLDVAFKKVCQIHKRLPAGGILLFLTGKNEIQYMCKRLSKALGVGKKGQSAVFQDAILSSGKEFDRFLAGLDADEIDSEDLENDDSSEDSDFVDEEEVGGGSEAEIEEDDDVSPVSDEAATIRNQMLREALGLPQKSVDEVDNTASKTVLEPEEDLTNLPLRVKILPLYAALEANLQQRVFESVEDGTRLIVVATNVAETSITIPGLQFI